MENISRAQLDTRLRVEYGLTEVQIRSEAINAVIDLISKSSDEQLQGYIMQRSARLSRAMKQIRKKENELLEYRRQLERKGKEWEETKKRDMLLIEDAKRQSKQALEQIMTLESAEYRDRYRLCMMYQRDVFLRNANDSTALIKGMAMILSGLPFECNCGVKNNGSDDQQERVTQVDQ